MFLSLLITAGDPPRIDVDPNQSPKVQQNLQEAQRETVLKDPPTPDAVKKILVEKRARRTVFDSEGNKVGSESGSSAPGSTKATPVPSPALNPSADPAITPQSHHALDHNGN